MSAQPNPMAHATGGRPVVPELALQAHASGDALLRPDGLSARTDGGASSSRWHASSQSARSSARMSPRLSPRPRRGVHIGIPIIGLAIVAILLSEWRLDRPGGRTVMRAMWQVPAVAISTPELISTPPPPGVRDKPPSLAPPKAPSTPKQRLAAAGGVGATPFVDAARANGASHVVTTATQLLDDTLSHDAPPEGPPPGCSGGTGSFSGTCASGPGPHFSIAVYEDNAFHTEVCAFLVDYAFRRGYNLTLFVADTVSYRSFLPLYERMYGPLDVRHPGTWPQDQHAFNVTVFITAVPWRRVGVSTLFPPPVWELQQAQPERMVYILHHVDLPFDGLRQNQSRIISLTPLVASPWLTPTTRRGDRVFGDRLPLSQRSRSLCMIGSGTTGRYNTSDINDFFKRQLRLAQEPGGDVTSLLPPSDTPFSADAGRAAGDWGVSVSPADREASRQRGRIAARRERASNRARGGKVRKLGLAEAGPGRPSSAAAVLRELRRLREAWTHGEEGLGEAAPWQQQPSHLLRGRRLLEARQQQQQQKMMHQRRRQQQQASLQVEPPASLHGSEGERQTHPPAAAPAAATAAGHRRRWLDLNAAPPAEGRIMRKNSQPHTPSYWTSLEGEAATAVGAGAGVTAGAGHLPEDALRAATEIDLQLGLAPSSDGATSPFVVHEGAVWNLHSLRWQWPDAFLRAGAQSSAHSRKRKRPSDGKGLGAEARGDGSAAAADGLPSSLPRTQPFFRSHTFARAGNGGELRRHLDLRLSMAAGVQALTQRGLDEPEVALLGLREWLRMPIVQNDPRPIDRVTAVFYNYDTLHAFDELRTCAFVLIHPYATARESVSRMTGALPTALMARTPLLAPRFFTDIYGVTAGSLTFEHSLSEVAQRLQSMGDAEYDGILDRLDAIRERMEAQADALLDRVFANASFLGVDSIGPGWDLRVLSGGGLWEMLNAKRLAAGEPLLGPPSENITN